MNYNVLELSEQEIIRRGSLNELRAMGIDPYPAAEYVTNAFSTDIKADFKDDAEPRQVSIAGRIMSRRVMGKASFVELQDSKGRIQVYITRDDICPDENKDMYNVSSSSACWTWATSSAWRASSSAHRRAKSAYMPSA